MKSKWVRVTVMFVAAFFALSLGQVDGLEDSTVANVTIIVGAILLIGGIVEIFRKPKIPPTV